MLRVAASVTTNRVTLCEGAGVGRVKPQDPVFWRLTPSRWNTTFGSISLCSIGPDHYFITQPPLCAPWWCEYYITGVPPESGKVPPTTESSDRRVQTSDGTRFGFRPLSCTFITVDETGCTDGTVCSWPSAGSVPIAVVTAQCERCDSTSKKFCAAGWWKVAKSPETTSGRNGGRQQERQSRARSKRPCETELSWQSSLKRCTFPARLIEAVSVFVFFKSVNYLQIIEEQLFTHFPRTQPVRLCAEWQPRQTPSSARAAPPKPRRLSDVPSISPTATHFARRLMKQNQTRHNYNDKEIFIKSFFVACFC